MNYLFDCLFVLINDKIQPVIHSFGRFGSCQFQGLCIKADLVRNLNLVISMEYQDILICHIHQIIFADGMLFVGSVGKCLIEIVSLVIRPLHITDIDAIQHEMIIILPGSEMQCQ